MKISRMAIILMATIGVVVATSDDDTLLRGGAHRELGDDMDQFQKFKATYYAHKNDNKARCEIEYRVSGEKKVMFVIEEKSSGEDVDESDNGRRVTCFEDDRDPEGGVDLTINEDIDLDGSGINIRWFDEDGDKQKVESAKLVWRKNSQDFKLVIKRDRVGTSIDDFRKLIGEYDAGKEECKLTYRIKGGGNDPVTIKIKEGRGDSDVSESENGRRVTCTRRVDKEQEGLELPVERAFTNDFTRLKWTNENDKKRKVELARLRWDREGDIRMVLKREPDNTFKPESLKAWYFPDRDKCKFQYKVKGGSKQTIWIDDDESEQSVDEKGSGSTKRVVCRYDDYDDPPGGLVLPSRGDIDEAYWDGSQDDVDEAYYRWSLDGDLKITIEYED